MNKLELPSKIIKLCRFVKIPSNILYCRIFKAFSFFYNQTLFKNYPKLFPLRQVIESATEKNLQSWK